MKNKKWEESKMDKSIIRITFGDENDRICTMIGDVDDYFEYLDDYIDTLPFQVFGYNHYPMNCIVCDESEDIVYILESRQMNCVPGSTRHRVAMSELNTNRNYINLKEGVFNLETSTGKFYCDHGFVNLNDAKDALEEMYNKCSTDILENYQFRIVEYVINRVYGIRTEGYQTIHFYSDGKWIEKFI